MPITAQTLKRFVRPVLVETGTFQGDGTAAALEAGFPLVHTVEIYPPLYYHAIDRFRDDDRVRCYQGSSIEHLPSILSSINEPVTFWLDSHYCGGATGGAWDTPLVGELRQIAQHQIKTHIILIDDVHLFGLDLPGLVEIQARLIDINRDYLISYAQSAEPSLGLDILIAMPPG